MRHKHAVSINLSLTLPPQILRTFPLCIFVISYTWYVLAVTQSYTQIPKFYPLFKVQLKSQLLAIPLLGIHTEETRSERDTCTPLFIAALFKIARTWKQPRCPSADKWIRKLWYIYTMEYYYSAIKKNTFESVLMRWIKTGAHYTE